METTPIALLVDDPCPIVHVFRDHWVDVHHKPPTPPSSFSGAAPGAPTASGRESEEGAVLISIPATVRDHWWKTIDSPRTDGAWISEIADLMLTEDGQSGDILRVLEAGGAAIKVPNANVQKNKPGQLVYLTPPATIGFPVGPYFLEVRARMRNTLQLRTGRLDETLTVV